MEPRHMLTSTSDPKHWRDRAEECKRIAEEYMEGTAKASMLICAEEYEEMAQRKERSFRRAHSESY